MGFISHHDAANIVGIIGVILVLVAYLFLQLDRISQDSVLYSLLNLMGSGLILYSLFFFWNLSAFIIEVAWLLISSYGMFKAIRLRDRPS